MSGKAQSPLRIAVVGAGGRIAADYLAVLDELPRFRVAGLVEVEAAARERLARQRKEPRVTDLTELKPTDLDAAVIVAPPALHEPLAMAAIDAGLHVFCEKPLATSPVAARRMLDRARARNRVLMMASKFRFTDDVVTARELLAAGAIGKPTAFRNAFRSIVPMTGRWNADPALAGGGVLIDNGTHAADLARFLLGDVERVRAIRMPAIQQLAVEDRVELQFESASGATGRVELSWSDPGGQPHYAEIDGSRGSIALGWGAATLRSADGAEREIGAGYDKRRAFAAQLEHFAAVVRREELPRIDDADAIASVHFVAAAYQSIDRDRWVDLSRIVAEEVA